MQGHRRRRATRKAGAPRSPATPISPNGGGGTASISLSLLLHDVSDIASLSLRELDAVALATNVMVFMGRDTSIPIYTVPRSLISPRKPHQQTSSYLWSEALIMVSSPGQGLQEPNKTVSSKPGNC